MENKNEPEQNEKNQEEKSTILPQKEKKNLTCISITCWVFQIIIWIGGIILLIIEPFKKSEYSDSKFPTFEFILISTFEFIFYILYVIYQFYSPTFQYLRHKRSDENLSEKMKQLFQTPPQIKFTCECYHY
jgi:ABC-type dipeptide/oligopeptide/nickel transport system permease component